MREAIAAKIVKFYHIRGKLNPADVLSKHWSYANVWSVLRPLLFWTGDTGDLMKPLDSVPSTEEAIPEIPKKQ